jgi:hypothetical protein
VNRGIEARRDSVAIPGVSLCIAKSYPASEITIFRICPGQRVWLLGGCRDAFLRLTHGIDSKSQSNQWLLAFTPNTASFGKDTIRGLQRIKD